MSVSIGYFCCLEAEFKEFEPRLKFESFRLKLYKFFLNFSRRLIKIGFLGDLRRGLNSLNSDTGEFSQSLKLHVESSNSASIRNKIFNIVNGGTIINN